MAMNEWRLIDAQTATAGRSAHARQFLELLKNMARMEHLQLIDHVDILSSSRPFAWWTILFEATRLLPELKHLSLHAPRLERITWIWDYHVGTRAPEDSDGQKDFSSDFVVGWLAGWLETLARPAREMGMPLKSVYVDLDATDLVMYVAGVAERRRDSLRAMRRTLREMEYPGDVIQKFWDRQRHLCSETLAGTGTAGLSVEWGVDTADG